MKSLPVRVSRWVGGFPGVALVRAAAMVLRAAALLGVLGLRPARVPKMPLGIPSGGVLKVIKGCCLQ